MIVLKSHREIDIMDASNKIVHEVLQNLTREAKPGVTTLMLDQMARDLVSRRGASPAFLGYNGYPACVCTSVNEEVVHGIPSSRVLKDGDVLSLDFGVLFNGYYGDAAVTIPIGVVSEKAKKLITVTREALRQAIDNARVGNRLSDISVAVQEVAEKNGFSVIRDYVGHGIGRELHEEPQIPNFGEPGRGPRLKTGMVFAIEPMISSGGWEIQVKSDGWTAITKDKSIAAHFEHSVAITEEGPLVLGAEGEI